MEMITSCTNCWTKFDAPSLVAMLLHDELSVHVLMLILRQEIPT